MTKTRYEEGLAKLSEIDGKGGEQVIESLRSIAPDVGRYIIEFAFGDIYTRKELSLKDREKITVASLLTAGGCEKQLEVHMNGALNVGITPNELVEICIQCIPYTGFPKVLNAINVAKQIFRERKLTMN